MKEFEDKLFRLFQVRYVNPLKKKSCLNDKTLDQHVPT